jgi:hypothetical protein
VQGNRDNLCLSMRADSAVPIVAAPLEAAWESIRAGFAATLGARTFDGWLKPAELGAFDADIGRARHRHAEPVHGRLGALAFRRAADAGVEDGLPIVRDVRDRCRRRCSAPTPLLILEEIPAAPQPAAERDPSGAQFRSALPVRDVRRRQGQRSRRDRRQDAGDRRQRRLQPACSSTAAPGAARPICCTPSARPSSPQPRRARRVDVGREVHGRVRPRAEGKRHDRLQAAGCARPTCC